MRPYPTAERIDNAAATQQCWKMIAFREDRQIDPGTEASNNVRNGIGVTVKRRNIGARRNHRPPDERNGPTVASLAIGLAAGRRARCRCQYGGGRRGLDECTPMHL